METQAQRPTLRTIAYMTGLGVTTVSRALNDAPDIGQATKERVQLVADQIGYRPNRAGVRLRTGRTNVISLVLSVENEALGLTSDIVYGVSEYLAATPFHLIVTPYCADADPLTPIRYVVETGSADGIIFSRTEPQDARVRYLQERRFPFATHGRTEMDTIHPYFDFDNLTYGRIAVERLTARGRRRLALLGPPPHLTYCGHMRKGFEQGLEGADIDEVALPGINTDSSYDAILAEVGRILATRRRPDGLVCGSAQSALAVLSAAEGAGLAVGRDFDVVVKESFDLMRKFRPEVISIREDFRAAGMGLAEAVVRAIRGEPPELLQTLQTPER